LQNIFFLIFTRRGQLSSNFGYFLIYILQEIFFWYENRTPPCGCGSAAAAAAAAGGQAAAILAKFHKVKENWKMF
jgi:hypothetical protein